MIAEDTSRPRDSKGRYTAPPKFSELDRLTIDFRENRSAVAATFDNVFRRLDALEGYVVPVSVAPPFAAPSRKPCSPLLLAILLVFSVAAFVTAAGLVFHNWHLADDLPAFLHH